MSKIRLSRVLLLAVLVTALVLTLGIVPVTASSHDDVTFATFNASMNRANRNDLVKELAVPGSMQPGVIANIIQLTRPDVLLINEFDWDRNGNAALRFQNNYLSVSQDGATPIHYPYRYVAASNTGVNSGTDLDNSGGISSVPGDAYGFGFFPGQFSFVVYSMYPIDHDAVRTFQYFLWKDMPGNLIPTDFYSSAAVNRLRLSSKNHVDVPVMIDGETVHFLASHPTPPVFDGPEDRNGRRNHDEIRFWSDYIAGEDYIYDDDGVSGGLYDGARFVIAGDLNADPNDGDSVAGAANLLTQNPAINNTVVPSSEGAVQASRQQRNANRLHTGDPAYDTADFFDGFPPKPFGGAPGNLRADYVLPDADMTINHAGVFWPKSQQPYSDLTGTFPFPSSDHRLVYINVSP